MLVGGVGWTAPVEVVLDGAAAGEVFEGIGAVSAGSSRLLIDYPSPQREQILDYLFLPHYGAALQHLKVEIGGDGNSNAVAEPSHMHSRDDTNFHRGYEWWLMEEAKRRNPAIKLSALAWNFPGWVDRANSQATIDYLVSYVEGARREHGLHMDYLGLWNETPIPESAAFIEQLRKALDEKHLDTKIIADDLVNDWHIAGKMQRDPEVRHSVEVIATHYPQMKTPHWLQARSLAWQKPLWSSEDGPWDDTWGAWGQQSVTYAEVLNGNYIGGRITSTLLWSLVTGYPENLGLPYSGLLRAESPWSAHYEVTSPVWVVAHTTQFAAPGWRYIDAASARMAGGGSYVTLHHDADYSVVVETMARREPAEIRFQVRNGLSSGPIHVWRTNAREQFVEVARLDPQAGRFSYTFDPDAVYTLTTTSGQRKGDAMAPPGAEFPLPYREDFDGYPTGATNPRYWIAQNGSFEVAPCPGGRAGQCLDQVVTQVPVHWSAWGTSTEAGIADIAGDRRWRNYRVGADVLIEEPGYAMLVGRLVRNDCYGPLIGYQFRLYDTGEWQLRRNATEDPIASGKVAAGLGTWRHLELAFRDEQLTGSIDGIAVLSIMDSQHTAGMAGFGSGWNRASFDRVEVAPLGADVPVIAPPPDPPKSPPAFRASILLPVAGDGSVTLRWPPVEGASGYHVRVGRMRAHTLSSGAPPRQRFDREIDVGGALQTTFHHLQDGVAYLFWVVPVNQAGAGEPSDPQYAKPVAPARQSRGAPHEHQ